MNSPSEYQRTLTAAWQQHLAPRENAAPTVISLFAGCGGSSLGYSMAGFRELLAAEWDRKACAALRENFPGVPVYEGDICKLTGKELLDQANIFPGQLDVLDGSPPCQGFSTSGRRDLSDPRSLLYLEFTRLLANLQPRAFVMENVYGLVKGKMRRTFAEMLRDLKAQGYRVKVRLLNAAAFGVPQSRERLIFIGLREDLRLEPSHPLPTVERPITASQGLAGVSNCPLELERLLTAGQRYVAYRQWPLIELGKNLQDVKGDAGSGFSCCRFHPDRPARTIVRNDSNLSMHGSMHWDEQRRFTTAEFARFMSFPDEYRFPGPWKANVAMLGNAVPPLMMREIATYVASLLVTSGT